MSENKPEFTDEQIGEAIADAIKEHRFEMVASLLKLLALQNPQQAGDIYGAIVNRELTVRIPLGAPSSSELSS